MTFTNDQLLGYGPDLQGGHIGARANVAVKALDVDELYTARRPCP